MNMNNRKIEGNTTKQVCIDEGIHRLLKARAARAGVTIRALLEGYISEILYEKNEGEI